MKPILSVRDLSVTYDGDVFAIRDVSFEAHAGKTLAIVGPNGSGKSTTIKAIVGLVPVATGEIAVSGQTEIKRRREQIIYVPQRADLDWDFPMTVRDVARQGRFRARGLFGRESAEDRRRVEQALELVGMASFADRQIGELSGGQQQRTFLARALAQDGELLLMDEPFQGVDAATERAIVDVLDTLKRQDRAVIVVHHALASVREYFDDVVLLNGRLVAAGSTDEVFTRQNLERAYGGQIAFLGDAAVAS